MSFVIKSQLDNLIATCLDDDSQNEVVRWIVTQATSAVLQSRNIGYDKFVLLQTLDADRVKILLDEIKEQDWFFNTARQDHVHVQKETQSICLTDNPHIVNINKIYNHDIVKTDLYDQYPLLTKFLHSFANDIGQGWLSRAMIVRLQPGKQVYPHIDMGPYYLFRDRYHIVLDSDGSRMKVHGEESTWHNGEVWWFNNNLNHEAHNDSDKWRIHVIFDVLPYRNYDIVKQIRDKFYSSRRVLPSIIEEGKMYL